MLPDIVTHIVMPGHGGRGRRIMNFETTLCYLAVTHLVQGQRKALSQKTKIQQVPHSQRLFKVAFFLSFKIRSKQIQWTLLMRFTNVYGIKIHTQTR